MGKRRRTRSPGDAEPRYHPAAHELEAETLVDEIKHSAARAGFNTEMLADQRVEQQFLRWWEQTGLRGWVIAVRDLPGAERVPRFESGALRDAIAAAAPLVVAEAIPFVRDTLRVRWAWVAFDLMEAFVCEAMAQGFGVTVSRGFEVRQGVLRRPISGSLSFSGRAGEPVGAALGRVIKQFLSAVEAADAAPLPGGSRRPKDEGSTMEKWARWYYRARVKGEPVATLGREYTAARRAAGVAVARDNHQTVLYGIRQAEKALAMGTWEIATLEK
jgi:hypothetical protein